MALLTNYLFVLSAIKIYVAASQEIESYSSVPIQQNAFQNDLPFERREVFEFEEFATDDFFANGLIGSNWKSVNLADHSIVVGFQDNEAKLIVGQITLDEKSNQFRKNISIYDLHEIPEHSLLFSDPVESLSQILVLVTSSHNLLWFNITGTQLTKIWSWPINKNISHINTFSIASNRYILLLCSNGLEHTLDIYRFRLNPSPNFWLFQTITVPHGFKYSTVMRQDDDYYLAIPLRNLSMVQILRWTTDMQFEYYVNFTSPRVDQVVSFEVGPTTYLAFNGLNGGIYKVGANGRFTREMVANFNLDRVHYYHPIQLHQNELITIIFVQKLLNHGTHNTLTVKVMIHNGQEFERHPDFVCDYFGEETLGLQCLVDDDSQQGIIGSAFIQLNYTYGMLVPRKTTASDFFKISGHLYRVQDPAELELEQLLRKKDKLGWLLAEQESHFKSMISHTAADPEALLVRAQPPTHLQALDTESQIRLIDQNNVSNLIDDLEGLVIAMKAKVRENLAADIHTLIFEGDLSAGTITVSDALVENIGGEPLIELLSDLVVDDAAKPVEGFKEFQQVEFDQLTVGAINEIPIGNFVFDQSNVTLRGDLLVEEGIEILNDLVIDNGRINNNVNLTDLLAANQTVDKNLHFNTMEILEDADFKSSSDSLSADKQRIDRLVEMKTLRIPQNLSVDYINGEHLNDLLGLMCLKNINTFIGGNVKILGNITADVAIVDRLGKDKSFATDFIYRNNNSDLKITGKKTFGATLGVVEMNTLILNGLDPLNFITLSANQTIPGETMFESLEVLKSLEVIGNISGGYSDKFLPNPTLEHSREILSNVNFDQLDVKGKILIANNFNGERFDSLLNCLVYKDEHEAEIIGLKFFSDGIEVKKNLHIDTERINGISIDSFVTKNTNQILNLERINGDVEFRNMVLFGRYDTINVSDLDRNSVKTSGDQFISGNLTLRENVLISNLEISKLLNMMPSNNYVFKSDATHNFNSSAQFDRLNCNELYVNKDFYAMLQHFNVTLFDEQRLSYSKEQEIISSIVADHIQIETLQANKSSIETFVNYDMLIERFLERITNENITVRDLVIDGNMTINRINEKPATNLGGLLWKKGFQNNSVSNISFWGDVHVDDLQLVKLSGVTFDRFISNLLFTNESTLSISANKIFSNGFTVKKLLETTKLNDIPIQDILTKEGKQIVQGPIQFNGAVKLENQISIEHLDGIDVDYIQRHFTYKDGNFIIRSNVLLDQIKSVEQLYINDTSVKNKFEKAVWTNQNATLDRETTFMNEVTVGGNIFLKFSLNGFDIESFAENVVNISEDSMINYPIIFTEPVSVFEQVKTLKSANCDLVSGINVTDWTDRAIHFNRGKLPGTFVFQDAILHEGITVRNWNHFRTEHFIPLKTNQSLNNMAFGSLLTFNDIKVKGAVSGFHLPSEHENSVLVDESSDISTPVTFHESVTVEGDVRTDLLNNFSFEKLVTTDTDQNLTAVYDFKGKVIIDGNVRASGLVNGINLTVWNLTTLKLVSDEPQVVTDNWTISRRLTFETSVRGNGFVSGMKMNELEARVNQRMTQKLSQEQQIIHNYDNMCRDLTYMQMQLSKQIFRFDYLEQAQCLQFEHDINHIFSFQYKKQNFLLINENSDECSSNMYKHDSTKFVFLESVSTGFVNQIITVRAPDKLYLVMRHQNSTSCNRSGISLWSFDAFNLTNIGSMGDFDLLQDSQIPLTFYGKRFDSVSEFRINGTSVVTHRQWILKMAVENARFVPRGFRSGLALATGTQLIYLHRIESLMRSNRFHKISNSDAASNTTTLGAFTSSANRHIPGQKNAECVVVSVGVTSSRRKMLAIGTWETSSLEGNMDVIRIYEDPINGKLFQTIPTYRPSFLTVWDMENGETLLLFLEDNRTLQMYEYKGFEGFKHRLSVEELKASAITETSNGWLALTIPGEVVFYQAKMMGSSINRSLKCAV